MKESVTSGLWAGSVMPRLLTRVVESEGARHQACATRDAHAPRIP